jgi:hypothetical protein
VCLTADRKGKINKREMKVLDFESKFCAGAGVPDFAYTSGTSVITVAEQAEIDVMHDLFGNPVDNGLFPCDPSVNQCLCRRNMINRIEKLMAKMPRVFAKCKKAALKLNDDPYPTGAASAAELQTCLDNNTNMVPQSLAADPGGQMAEVVALLTTTLQDQCEDTGVTGVSFPGVCNGLTGNTARDCIVRLARCRTCLMINAMDGLSADCDDFDNGAADTTCPPP